MAIFYEYKNKKGSYLKTRYNNHTQTLQINTSANKFFRNKMNLENGDEISNTIIHALIAFGDIHANHRGPDNKKLLDDMVKDTKTLSNSNKDMLRNYIHERMTNRGISKRKFNTTNNFLKKETDIKPFVWMNEYNVNLNIDTSKNKLSDIADKYF